MSNEVSSPTDPKSRNAPVPFIGGTLSSLTYVRPEKFGIISAALVDLGVPAREAEAYEGSLRDGSLLACVCSQARCTESALQAFVQTGAEKVIAARRGGLPRIPETESLKLV